MVDRTKDAPILFSGPMVRALLARTKTQTRRVVTSSNSMVDGRGDRALFGRLRLQRAWVDPGPSPAGNPGPYLKASPDDGDTIHRIYPRAAGVDSFWVKERIVRSTSGPEGLWCNYAADGERTPADDWPWKRDSLPSIHCPYGLSRLRLRPLSVVPERLQDISAADAFAEGVAVEQLGPMTCAIDAFANLWDSINGKRAPWASNPWVWVIRFEARRVRPAW